MEARLHVSPATKTTRGPALFAGASLLAVLASLFGLLETTARHPSLKLGAAIFLAGAGSVLVVTTRSLAPDPNATTRLGSVRAGSVTRAVMALLSMAAGLVHFAVISQHFEEYWLYGTFFVVIALWQLVWAFLLVRAERHWVDVLAALGNLATAAAWAVTRTVGALVGPDATEAAKAGFGDLVSTVFEVLIVLGALMMVARRTPRPGGGLGRQETRVSVAAISVSLLTLLALYSAVGGSPFVSHVG
jgi:hypothetical protein